MKKHFIKGSLALFFASSSIAHAVSYQIFAGMNYSNPAALNSVKKAEMIVGGAALYPKLQFDGTAAGVGGTATSHTTDFLPYGRLAARLAPQWVVGIDITEPYFTDIRYPRDSVVRFFATETIIQDVNYSPRVSYQVNPKLALGLGFDANNLFNAQLNFAVPPFGVLTNKAASWAYGWDVGLFYMLSPATFLNAMYYAQIIHHVKGPSNWGPFNSRVSATAVLPATGIVNLVHIISPKWIVSGTARYTAWDPVRFTVLHNTALGNITIPQHYFSNASGEVGLRYQADQKWALLGGLDYEPNVQPTAYRQVGLPVNTFWIPAVGAEYAMTKELKAKLIYAHVFSNPPLNMTNAVGQLLGRVNMNTDALDFSITYDI